MKIIPILTTTVSLLGYTLSKTAIAAPTLLSSLDPERNLTNFEEMKRVLQLSNEEEQRLQKAFAQRNQAVATWKSQHEEKLSALETEIAQAVGESDLATLKEKKAQAKPLRSAYLKIIEQGEKNIPYALPTQKRIHWFAYLYSSHYLKITAPLELNEEQRKAVIDQFVQQAKAFEADTEETKTLAKYYLQGTKKIESELLYEEQKQMWPDLFRSNPLPALPY